MYRDTRWRWNELRGIPHVYAAKLYALEKLTSILSLGRDKLKNLTKKYPPPLIFLLPRKRAIALFSVLAGVVAEMNRKSPPASFEQMADFLDVDVYDLKHYVRYRLCLYKLVAPIRHLLGLPQDTDPYHFEVSLNDEESRFLLKFSSPSSIMKELYNIAKLINIRATIRFTYSLVQTVDRIARYIRKSEETNVHRSIDYLARRYKDIIELFNFY